MKVYLVQTRKPDEVGAHQIDSIWLTRKLAHAHAASTAAEMVETPGIIDQGRGWTGVEAVIRPNDDRIQVRLTRQGSNSFMVLRTWYIEEHELRGDVVSALAAEAE